MSINLIVDSSRLMTEIGLMVRKADGRLQRVYATGGSDGRKDRCQNSDNRLQDDFPFVFAHRF